MTKAYFVYIVTNFTNTTLYIGVTNDLDRRLYEHKQGMIGGFTSKYKLTKLVYYEECNDIYTAISREKQLKNWHRDWKVNLVKRQNPNFLDLTHSE